MGDGVKKLKKTSVRETLIADSSRGRGASRRCPAPQPRPRWIRCNYLQSGAATTSENVLQFPPQGSCKKTLSEYTIGVLFTAAVLFIFFSSDGRLAIIGVNVKIAQFFSTIKPDSGRLLKI